LEIDTREIAGVFAGRAIAVLVIVAPRVPPPVVFLLKRPTKILACSRLPN